MIVRAKKEGDEMSPLRKGMKLTDNPRNIRLEIRMTKSENETLEWCAKEINCTRTDILIKGLRLVKEELDKK